METLIIIALILAGLLLFAVEVFLVPGITLAGIASGISLLYAIYYAFHSVGTQAGFITLAVEAVGIIGITIWFMRSKTVDRLSLKQTLDYKPEPLKGIPKSKLIRKLEAGDRNIYREYIAFCNYKGKRHAMLLKRRKAEFALLYVP